MFMTFKKMTFRKNITALAVSVVALTPFQGGYSSCLVEEPGTASPTITGTASVKFSIEHYEELSAEIIEGLVNCPNLTALEIIFAQKGILPEGLAAVGQNLTTLSLHCCAMHFPTVDFLSNFPNLEKLHVGRPGFNCPLIPLAVAHMQNLKKLRVNDDMAVAMTEAGFELERDDGEIVKNLEALKTWLRSSEAGVAHNVHMALQANEAASPSPSPSSLAPNWLMPWDGGHYWEGKRGERFMALMLINPSDDMATWAYGLADFRSLTIETESETPLPDGISALSHLKELKISIGNTTLLPSDIGALRALTDCHIVLKRPKGDLKGLPFDFLTHLNLSHPSADFDYSGLRQATRLTHLELSGRKTPAILQNLLSVTHLSLAYCEVDIAILVGMKNLKSIRFQGTHERKRLWLDERIPKVWGHLKQVESLESLELACFDTWNLPEGLRYCDYKKDYRGRNTLKELCDFLLSDAYVEDAPALVDPAPTETEHAPASSSSSLKGKEEESDADEDSDGEILTTTSVGVGADTKIHEMSVGTDVVGVRDAAITARAATKDVATNTDPLTDAAHDIVDLPLSKKEGKEDAESVPGDSSDDESNASDDSFHSAVAFLQGDLPQNLDGIAAALAHMPTEGMRKAELLRLAALQEILAMSPEELLTRFHGNPVALITTADVGVGTDVQTQDMAVGTNVQTQDMAVGTEATEIRDASTTTRRIVPIRRR